MWRELSLVGHWIHDATILHWSALPSEIAKGDIKPGAVIDLLLTVPTSERDALPETDTRAQSDGGGFRRLLPGPAPVRRPVP